MEEKDFTVIFYGRQPSGYAFAYFDTRKAGGTIIEFIERRNR